MVVDVILGAVVGLGFVWLFLYSAALIGARHALREADNRTETSITRTPGPDPTPLED